MRIAIYGGSFNPPHMGHALVAAWLQWTDKADQVWLLPTYEHAFGKDLAPWAKRLAWCRAFANDVGGVEVCTIERDLPTPSYTIDTLRALASRHAEHTFRLVIGSDNLAVLDKWKAWEAIERDFAPIVVGRTGYPCPPGAMVFPEVSSTDVRDRLARGDAVDHLVPASVLALLAEGTNGSPLG